MLALNTHTHVCVQAHQRIEGKKKKWQWAVKVCMWAEGSGGQIRHVQTGLCGDTFICASNRLSGRPFKNLCVCVCVSACVSIMLFGAGWCSSALNLAGSLVAVIYHSTRTLPWGEQGSVCVCACVCVTERWKIAAQIKSESERTDTFLHGL